MAYELLQDQYPIFRLIMHAFRPMHNYRTSDYVFKRGFCNDPWIMVETTDTDISHLEFHKGQWESPLTPSQWHELLTKGSTVCSTSIELSKAPYVLFQFKEEAIQKLYNDLPFGMKGIDEDEVPYFNVNIYDRKTQKHREVKFYLDRVWKTSDPLFEDNPMAILTLLANGERVNNCQLGGVFLPDKKTTDEKFINKLTGDALFAISDAWTEENGFNNSRITDFYEDYSHFDVWTAIEHVKRNF